MKSMQRVAYKQVAVNSTTPRSAASATRRRTIHSSRKYAARYEEGRRRTKAEIKRSLSWVGMWTRRNANRKQSIYTLLSALYRTTKRQSLKTKDRSETHSNCEWWTCSRPMHSDPRLRTPTLPVTFGHPPCLTKLIIMNMRVCVFTTLRGSASQHNIVCSIRFALAVIFDVTVSLSSFRGVGVRDATDQSDPRVKRRFLR